ncbi:MAG: Holliday junction branch migration DNA helicase RuvB [Chlamydiota bacterium]|nr:Holliday junction branch migration DNA helicase RuvB [Chlamydiota bacterium]
MSSSFIHSSMTEENRPLEYALRPRALSSFCGQPEVIEKLKVFIGAAKKRGEALGHALFHGPPGLGKTSLAHMIAHEMESNITVTSGPLIDKPSDLAGILTNLKAKDILFIDEIHRLPSSVEEYLYPAMEDFSIDLLLDSGPQSRSVQIKLEPFTLIGATTRMGLLTSPMRSRFPFTCRLNYYTPSAIKEILARSSSLLNLEITEEAFEEIAQRCRGTPRIANNLLKWVRDYGEMRSQLPIQRLAASEALDLLQIDAKGLDEIDKRMLSYIVHQHGGGPVGINAIAAAIAEEASSLEEVNEPFLIMMGFLKRSPRGREATPLGTQHIHQYHLKEAP